MVLPDDMVKIVAWEESAKQGETAELVAQFSRLNPGDKIALLVGPEGGLNESELNLS